MPIIASALLLCHLPLAASSPRPTPSLRIDLVFEGLPITRRLEAEAMREATKIWAAYGVDIKKLSQNDPGRDGALRLPVVLVTSADVGGLVDRLGSIEFVGDMPRPSIALYPNAIDALLSNQERLNGGSPELAIGFRDFTLGRVLGRALAHEIGHYLLRSRQHSATGLMRARWMAPDVIALDGHGFALSSDEVTRLESVLSTSLCDGSGPL
jgi:hypothetical protein